jgi:type II secretory pathway pseudopilin PulG
MRAGDAVGTSMQRGFTYVWCLAAIAVMGLGLALLGPQWADEARRDKEAELLRIGTLYAEAIASYYHASPGSLKRYPATLEELLVDTRFVGVKRHLRRAYADPLQPSQPWGIVRAADGGVRGVYSQSPNPPLRAEPLDLGVTRLPASARYSDWHFVPKVD